MEQAQNRRRVYVWNTSGSLLNALASLILLMLINRLLGEAAGGVFSIGFACAQIVYSVSCYEMLTYQVTDASRFGYGTYGFTKLLLFGVSLAVAAAQLFFYGLTGEKALVALFLCLYKAVDGFDVLFMATLQKNERLDLYGMSLSARMVVSMGLFALVLLQGGGLALAVGVFCLFNCLWVVTVDAWLSQRYEAFQVRASLPECLRLLWDCFPLFLYGFVITYIANESKYILNGLYSEEIQNAYAIILMPAFALNLLGLFASRPLVTTLAGHLSHNPARFRTLLWQLLGLLGVLTALAAAGAWVLGIPILSALYGVDLSAYKAALMLIVLGGGANAVVGLLYHVITIMRRQRAMACMALAVLALLKLVGRPLVQAYAMNGAAMVYLIGMAALALLFFGLVFWRSTKNTKKEAGGE